MPDPDPAAQPGTVEPADIQDVLRRLAELPVSVWSYVYDDPAVRHLGPMAQDFRQAFGLGDSETVIHNVDAQGVALAAIQALYRVVQGQQQQLDELRAQLEMDVRSD